MVHPLNPLTFPLHGTRLIEASAGTGKTYTIAALYVRLVLGHGDKNAFVRPLTPPEILVVTFTNAATQELRDRIRSRLTQAAAFFRHQDPGDDFLVSLGENCDEDTWPGNARLLDQAAQWMDEAAIFTIHSWSQRMLKRYAFGSGSLFDLELAPGEDQLMEQAACDYWRATFYPLPASQLAMVLNTLGVTTPQALLAKVRPFMGAHHPAPPREPREILEQREAVIERARQCWASDFEKAADLVRRARTQKDLNGNKYREASLEKWLKEMKSWIAGKCELPGEKALVQLSAFGLAAGKSKKGVPPEHPAFDALDALNTALEELDLEPTLYVHGAGQIKARVDREKNRQALVGFDDLLTQLEQAIHRPGNEQLPQMIRQQFPVALVDEFQDTDPVQYSTLGTIYLNQPDTGFFMIGDPKQAIYAFRGADIHTYLLARKDAADRLYTLDTNYRSAGDMVAAVNYFFDLATVHEQGPFLFYDEIPFTPVKARGREDRFFVEDQFPRPLTLWKEDQEEPITKTGDKGYIHHMADVCAGEMVRLLNLAGQSPAQCGFKDRLGSIIPLTPGDMAILVRNKTEAAAVRQALDHRGVRTVYLSDKRSVFESPEALDLLYLLRACASPGNAGYIKTALGTDLLDLSFAFLDNLTMDELAWEAEGERFRQYHLIWHHNGVLPMVRALLRDFKVPARLLATSMGERRLTNVLHLAELIQAKAMSLDGEHAVIRWFTRQLGTPDTVSDEGILRLESDENLVKVVTIHKSKGLEYPLVFLPFICSHRKVAAGKSPVFWHDEQGRRQVGINPGDTELEKAAQEALAEDLRLLYVAMTRACHACFLGMGVVGKMLKKGETNEFHCSGIGHVITGGKEHTTREIFQLLDNMGQNCDDICVTVAPECPDMLETPGDSTELFAPARHFSHPGWQRWFITSYSGISDGATMPDTHVPGKAPDADMADSDSPDSARADQLMEAEFEPGTDSAIITPARSIHTFARGPEPGTFLHDLFEWAAKQGFDIVAKNPGMIQEHLSLVCPRHGWEEWVEPLANWFHQLLLTPLHLTMGSDPFMSLSHLDRHACYAEMEFMFSATHVDTRSLDQAVNGTLLAGVRRPLLKRNRLNGMVKGFMDLVFVFQEKYYVMDYKSNYLGEDNAHYTRQAMGDAMLAHRYDLQLVLYNLALHRLLKSRLPDYDYDIHVGGAVYLFLRGVDGTGNGVYGERPPRALVEKLDGMFTGKVSTL
ncbi:DNA helicase/exodeoxyribonuclease V, beta subunit [Desulfocicer vacuolatum DSM 3385]|uniref:DNA 3'-5' helicase n=1 Tax=Desulfocicer vacuolatum DSM 3385 TaxID=1121400 RepID=A0A1W2AGJ6_9BACT|nr:exodeoxyribonuclease V subunit beta [Desulfocicer vacuolatum]SMC59612.1 DNA helicase/exodeoxyribonuclease V, beta subunit [Desulfocicer vacuolatum DSM 3385]